MPSARLHRWDEIALEKVTEMMSQKIITGEREMLAQIYLKRGALIPMHAHDSEQMTYILQGALRFLVDGEEVIVREGEVLHIPANVTHQAEALEDTFELDVFSADPDGVAAGRGGRSRVSVHAPIDVVGAAAGVDVELSPHPVDPPLQEPVLDF